MQRATGNMTLSEIYTQGVFFQLPTHPDGGLFAQCCVIFP